MFLFFFKQKTGYEMRISDWSSDVCSSDLKSLLIDFLSRVRFAQFDGRTRSVFCESTFFGRFRPCRFAGSAERTLPQRKLNDSSNTQHRGSTKMLTNDQEPAMAAHRNVPLRRESQMGRSEERRVGKEWERTGRYGGSPYN